MVTYSPIGGHAAELTGQRTERKVFDEPIEAHADD
jgi:hypothetical protein